MATSPDHPELVFLEALQTDGKPMYTKGRPDGPPLWIVVHDMEANETDRTAEATAQYFHTGAGGRSVSSHYTADNNSVVQCVLLQDVAWTVGNRAGNYRGINWEFSGFARQTRAEWLDPFGIAMFNQAAPIIRSDAARFGIPLQRRTIEELRARVPGVTSHNDLRLAFGVTDHTDPGPNFPWDVFLAIINGEDDMNPRLEHNLDRWLSAVLGNTPEVTGIILDTGVEVDLPNWLHVPIPTTGGGGSASGPVDLTTAALDAIEARSFKAAQRAEDA